MRLDTAPRRAALAQPADCWIDVIDFGTDQSFVERAEPSTQVQCVQGMTSP